MDLRHDLARVYFKGLQPIHPLSGQPQGQDGVKVQSSPVTVAVGNMASGSSMSPEQLGSVQSSSEQDVPPNKRLRRVACSCPNCRDGEGRSGISRRAHGEEPHTLSYYKHLVVRLVLVEAIFSTVDLTGF